MEDIDKKLQFVHPIKLALPKNQHEAPSEREGNALLVLSGGNAGQHKVWGVRVKKKAQVYLSLEMKST